MRILLVEDDLMLGDSVNAAISAEGYVVDWIADGGLAESAVRAGSYDLLILDHRLPNVSGIDLLKSLRASNCNTPVLLLTACDSLNDKIAGLDAGADDYLTKPFDMDELFARIRSLLRRLGGKGPILKAADLELDPASRQVRFRGDIFEGLTAKEYSVLELLLRNRGRFLTKSRLLESCNSWGDEVESNTIEVYVSRLRKYFGHDFIETLRNVGYRIK